MLRWFYRIHKWIGIGVGVFLLMWIVTGMLLSGGEGRPSPARPLPDFHAAIISPAQAVLAATTGDSALGGVKALEIDRLGERVVYRVVGAPRGIALVDAASGQRIRVTDSLARALAQGQMPGATIRGVEMLSTHDRGYPGGRLPVWRVSLEDPEGTSIQVGVADGVVSRSTTGSRLSSTLHGLHTFGSLQVLRLERPAIRRWLMAVSLVALVSVLTGYYLALPRRRAR